MTTKTEALQEILRKLEAGEFEDKDKKRLVFKQADGTTVRLSDPNAAELLRQRIATGR